MDCCYLRSLCAVTVECDIKLSFTEPCRNVLLPSQLDEIFKEIDDYDPSQSLEHNLPVQLNNFAVFRCTPSRPSVGPVVCAPPPSTPSFHSLDSPLTTGSLCRAASASDTEPQGGRVTLSPQALAASIQNEATVAVAVSGALPVDDLSDQYYSTAILPGSQHDVFVTHRPSENGDHDFPQASNNSSPYDWLNQIPANDQPLHPAPQVDDFLMRHYMERVCYLFCAIDTPKSPWKTIHLPRALQGIGELKITGHTSKVRNALRNALLSISSWYLSNDCRRHDADDVADRWADVATDYGSDAIALLKSAIEFDLYHSTRPRYKDFLATMLSMITVNVSACLSRNDSHRTDLDVPSGYVGEHKYVWRSS